jgi:hypothetical protein
MARLLALGLFVGFAFLGRCNAQDSRADLFGGYSMVHADLGAGAGNLNGFGIAYAVRPRLAMQWWAFVMDYNVQFGTALVPLADFCNGVTPCVPPSFTADVRTFSTLFGVRFAPSRTQFTPFVQALFGGSSLWANGNGMNQGIHQSRGSFAYVLGAGVDYPISDRIGWRVQGDFLQTHYMAQFQSGGRFSTGPVIVF